MNEQQSPLITLLVILIKTGSIIPILLLKSLPTCIAMRL